MYIPVQKTKGKRKKKVRRRVRERDGKERLKKKEDKKEMKRRSSEGERERNKKRDGKAEHTHALIPESIFREGVTSLGLPKAHSAPGKPKEFAIGRGCVSESKWMLPPKVSVPTWTGSHGKKRREWEWGKGTISQSKAEWLAGNSTMRPGPLTSLQMIHTVLPTFLAPKGKTEQPSSPHTFSDQVSFSFALLFCISLACFFHQGPQG